MFHTFCNGQVKSTGLSKLNRTEVSSQNNVHAGLQDKKGNLWFVTTGDGVYRYDGKSFTNFTTSDGLNSNSLFSILEDKKGNIWLGTNAGLSYYDGKTFTHIPLSFTTGKYLYPSISPENNPSTNNGVTAMLEDKSGKLWFGTDNGVYCYDGKAFTRFLDNQTVINSNGLTLRLVQCMLEDKDGNIWITTKLEGVCCYDGKSIINYKPDNQEWFRGLLEDKNGNIWVGTRYNGVYRYDARRNKEGGFIKVFQNGTFDTYSVLSIMQDKSGNIWFATEAGDQSKRESEGGVWVYNGIIFKNFTKNDGLSNNAVWCAFEDKTGNLWFGSRNTGLSRYDGKTFISFSE
jgi:ligand-binding sensor domain-containing protein